LRVVSGLAQEAYVKTVIASFGSGARSGHSMTSSARIMIVAP
jgi:hypothetical protein